MGLREINQRHTALVRSNLRAEADRREAIRLAESSRAVEIARPYLDVLELQLTDDEIDRQLNANVAIMRTGYAQIPISAEADTAFTRVMMPDNFGDYGSGDAMIELATRCGSPLAARLQEFLDAGFTMHVLVDVNSNYKLKITPVEISHL